MLTQLPQLNSKNVNVVVGRIKWLHLTWSWFKNHKQIAGNDLTSDSQEGVNTGKEKKELGRIALKK